MSAYDLDAYDGAFVITAVITDAEKRHQHLGISISP
jgi:hypothetical protein